MNRSGIKRVITIDRLIVCLIVLLLLLISRQFIAHAELMDNTDSKESYHDSKELIASLQEQDIEITQYVVQHNEMLQETQSKREIEELKQKIEKSFKINLKQMSRSPQKKGELKFQGTGEIGRATIQIAVIASPTHMSPQRYTTHIIFRMNLFKIADWELAQNTFAQSLMKIGLQPEINTSVQGIYPKALAHQERERLIQEMFTHLEGTITEGHSSESVVSLTGFSKKLTRSIETPQGLMNIQIAAHVHSNKHQTVLTIGNPIIVMEY